MSSRSPKLSLPDREIGGRYIRHGVSQHQQGLPGMRHSAFAKVGGYRDEWISRTLKAIGGSRGAGRVSATRSSPYNPADERALDVAGQPGWH